ncbi:hypothetical protein RYZ20_15605 [Thioclava sp. A2]|uniref:hypothetical protein n=1 Tax=Thioclava sp. FCG-A2 TaxID=3080562 RepID=UPI00295548B5|nr:hypothetical protein [Thioclava sp. A2]MDV7272315.1 hypothetical protein [Thioclava sp. A2]
MYEIKLSIHILNVDVMHFGNRCERHAVYEASKHFSSQVFALVPAIWLPERKHFATSLALISGVALRCCAVFAVAVLMSLDAFAMVFAGVIRAMCPFCSAINIDQPLVFFCYCKV